jgi:hypothetical protein
MRNDEGGCIGMLVGSVLFVGVSLLLFWLVFSSDLPLWFKFWLLS